MLAVGVGGFFSGGAGLKTALPLGVTGADWVAGGFGLGFGFEYCISARRIHLASSFLC